MTRLAAAQRLLALRDLGARYGLTTAAYVPGTPILLFDFLGGLVAIDPEPPIEATETAAQDTADYQLTFRSWDGQHVSDVTQLGDDEFVTFMRAQSSSARPI